MTDHSVHATVTVLAPRRRTAPRVGPVKHCPACLTELYGGPIVFDCPACERSVRAADVDTEFHAPLRGAA